MIQTIIGNDDSSMIVCKKKRSFNNNRQIMVGLSTVYVYSANFYSSTVTLSYSPDGQLPFLPLPDGSWTENAVTNMFMGSGFLKFSVTDSTDPSSVIYVSIEDQV